MRKQPRVTLSKMKLSLSVSDLGCAIGKSIPLRATLRRDVWSLSGMVNNPFINAAARTAQDTQIANNCCTFNSGGRGNVTN